MVTPNEYALYNYIAEYFKRYPLDSSQACLRVVRIVFLALSTKWPM